MNNQNRLLPYGSYLESDRRSCRKSPHKVRTRNLLSRRKKGRMNGNTIRFCQGSHHINTLYCFLHPGYKPLVYQAEIYFCTLRIVFPSSLAI